VNVPDSIRAAVACLRGHPGVVISSSPEFIPTESAWAVQLRLISRHQSDFVPLETSWVVLLDASYPTGSIRIFPAKENSLVHTFPHQDRNVMPRTKQVRWRSGKPCLDSPSQRLGRIAGGPEPREDAELRLRWHIERCLAWIDLAATSELKLDDEPFEIPQNPDGFIDTRFSIVHDEGRETWPDWKNHLGEYGEIEWAIFPWCEKTLIADRFFDTRRNRIRGCRRTYQPSVHPGIGYWWLWPSPIVIPPWHTPGTWSELRKIGKRFKVDVDSFICWMTQRIRDQKDVIILLGYPIPTHWNGDPREVHWQAILSPHVPSNIKPMDGFRPNTHGINQRLRRDIFGDGKKLSYLRTANWHPERLQARGRLHSEITKRPIAIIGAGALGSTIAELMVRGGAAEILIIDDDNLEAGNLVRHTLTSIDIGRNKADAIASRLQGASPMAHIKPHTKRISSKKELVVLLDPFEIIVDCTGEDDVLSLLGAAWWSIPKYFLSASLGFAAKRLFLFGMHACCFPFENFESAVRPWLDEERSKWSAAGETLEGTGCWSPLFPAPGDDVWLAAVTTVKYLERTMRGEISSGLHVLEQPLNRSLVGYQPAEINNIGRGTS